MKSKKFLAVAVCGMTVMALGQGVSAAEAGTGTSSANDVPVSYNYTSTAEPVSPDYAVSIPTGLVFDATNPTDTIDTTVKMEIAKDETSIPEGATATVTVKSAKEYKVALADGTDAIAYTLKYGTVTPTGTTETKIGVLKKTASADTDVLELKGTAKLSAVATRTGNHVDTLTYTITNGNVTN